MARGERSGNARLTEDDVRKMRELWDNGNGLLLREIATRFGVSIAAVSYIVNRQRWAHVD